MRQGRVYQIRQRFYWKRTRYSGFDSKDYILSYKFKQDVIKKIPQQIVISSLEMKVKELERFLPHHKINLQEQQQQISR